ncbi:MAG: hypothetical protein ACLU4N_13790 [Butyricimonas faecihominis]
MLSKRDYALVIGEALAVRTYMQFDIFRLFAPVYSAETENRAAIPLYDKPTDVPASILTCGEVANRLISDIDSAIYLLQQDPILTDGIVLDDEDFWAYRNVRMLLRLGLRLECAGILGRILAKLIGLRHPARVKRSEKRGYVKVW